MIDNVVGDVPVVFDLQHVQESCDYYRFGSVFWEDVDGIEFVRYFSGFCWWGVLNGGEI